MELHETACGTRWHLCATRFREGHDEGFHGRPRCSTVCIPLLVRCRVCQKKKCMYLLRLLDLVKRLLAYISFWHSVTLLWWVRHFRGSGIFEAPSILLFSPGLPDAFQTCNGVTVFDCVRFVFFVVSLSCLVLRGRFQYTMITWLLIPLPSPS